MNVQLYRGDCIEMMQQHIADQSVPVIVTDPPYGTNYKSGRQGFNGRGSFVGLPDQRTGRAEYFSEIANDEAAPVAWLSEAYRVLASGGALYLFCHWKTWGDFYTAATSAGFDVKNMIVLNKSNHGMGDLKGGYAPKHELLLYASKGRHLLRFPDKRQRDVWDVPVRFSGARRHHPNEKPVSWMEPAILNSSAAGDVVLDPFMGSGSTGAACLNTGRNFIGIEMDEVYFNVAQERLRGGET
jgi:site-specific DNA-methyltransferase (adenine-specific)